MAMSDGKPPFLVGSAAFCSLRVLDEELKRSPPRLAVPLSELRRRARRFAASPTVCDELHRKLSDHHKAAQHDSNFMNIELGAGGQQQVCISRGSEALAGACHVFEQEMHTEATRPGVRRCTAGGERRGNSYFSRQTQVTVSLSRL